MSHRKILDKLLIEKGMKKQDFAVRLGYGKNNYTNALNKDTYSENLIKKISDVLNVNPSVFDDESSMMAMEEVNDYKAMTTISEVEILKKTVELLQIQMWQANQRIGDLERKLEEKK